MTVTRISGQVKNTDRVSVYVDGKYSFSLSFNQLLDTKLKVGTEVTDEDLEHFNALSKDGKLKMRTLEWLMIRPRSS
jgi:hypothetical protein